MSSERRQGRATDEGVPGHDRGPDGGESAVPGRHEAGARRRGPIGIQNGTLLINSLHTTIAVFVNEFQPALLDDLGAILQRLIPRRDGYRHDDPRHSDCDRANAHAHLRATLLGHPIALAMADGEVLLGQYQSVILAELDGPRERKLQVQIVGE